MDDSISPYFFALNEEISMASLNESVIDTIYFGGGTPTCVDLTLIEKTLKHIFSEFNISDNAEITIECNPGTIDLAGLRLLKECGFNRLSIGLQSTNNALLKILGRIHTVQDFEECLKSARLVGFDNISLDLMYGLPNQTLSAWNETLTTALSYDVQHISCYALKIEEGTPFASKKLVLPDDDEIADMYNSCVEKLKASGYNRYEISNFAKSNYQSRHNLKYWRCEDFRGFGAGAFSCVENKRFSNETCVATYIEKINNKQTVVTFNHNQTENDLLSEFVFLGLRCADGISVEDFNSRFKKDIFDVFEKPLKKYISMGFLKYENGKIFFTDKSFFVSNTILSDFV